MTTSVTLPGVGLLDLEHRSADLSTWRLRRPVVSSVPVAVTFLIEGDDDLDELDLPMIVRVLDDVDGHLAAGLRFVQVEVLADPGWFGLAEDRIDAYRDVPAAELPLDDPQLTFSPGREWLLHFQEGRFPVGDPYGLAVVFDRHEPVRMEDLSTAEQIG